jgi:hypothetical protein
MSNIANLEAPVIAQAAVAKAPLAGTATEKRLGRGSIDATSVRASHLTEDSYDDEVTEEDLRTLRRVSGKIPWTAFTVAFVELCERFSYYGTTVVCMLRKPGPNHNGQRTITDIVQSSTSSNSRFPKAHPPVPGIQASLAHSAWVSEPRLVSRCSTSSGLM